MRDAYSELATCRPVGMGGLGAIPWTAIHAYAEAKGLADPTTFERLIRLIDSEVLKMHRHRREESR